MGCAGLAQFHIELLEESHLLLEVSGLHVHLLLKPVDMSHQVKSLIEIESRAPCNGGIVDQLIQLRQSIQMCLCDLGQCRNAWCGIQAPAIPSSAEAKHQSGCGVQNADMYLPAAECESSSRT